MNALDRLKEMAKAWGGEVREDDWLDWPETHASVSTCPFDDHLAIDYDRRRVMIRAGHELGSIPHEMGHVFASMHHPQVSEEWSFFGWEYLVAKRAGCAADWDRSSDNYQIPAGVGPHGPELLDEFGRLAPREKRRVLAERIRFARRAGLIKGGVPVCVRRDKAKP